MVGGKRSRQSFWRSFRTLSSSSIALQPLIELPETVRPSASDSLVRKNPGVSALPRVFWGGMATVVGAVGESKSQQTPIGAIKAALSFGIIRCGTFHPLQKVRNPL